MIKRLNSQVNPAIYLRGVRHEDIKNILEFMYLGVVNVCQESLESFLSVAQDLCIKGLTQDHNYSPSASSSSHQGVKRTYKSSNGDIVKTSYPKKEPKIEPGTMAIMKLVLLAKNLIMWIQVQFYSKMANLKLFPKLEKHFAGNIFF